MDEVLQLAMKLPNEDRLRLAEALLSSIEPTGQQEGRIVLRHSCC